MIVGDRLIHGDAWSLASLFTHARQDIAGQEVLYIGQSFAEGKRNAGGRTRQHQTLQKIYEDHVGTEYDIFVSPLELAGRSWSSDDHIEDHEEGPKFDLYYDSFAVMNGGIKKCSVDLIEHSLIAHFDPPYNQKLKHWNSANPTQAMRSMREAGFRLLLVFLENSSGIARFYSNLVDDPVKNHLIMHDLPCAPARPQLRGVSSDRLSDWRPAAQTVRFGAAMFAGLGEFGGVELRVFGEEAPEDRRPPDVRLPEMVVSGQNVNIGLPSTKAVDRKIKKQRRRLLELRSLRKYPRKPSYRKGRIDLGGGSTGEKVRWRLYNSVRNVVDHGVVQGLGVADRSALLAVVAREAIRSSRFDLVHCGELDSDEQCRSAPRWKGERASVVSTDCRRAVELASDVLQKRIANGGWKRAEPTSRNRGLLVIVADFDFGDRECVSRVKFILKYGGEWGVAIALGVSDIETAVEIVGEELMEVGNQFGVSLDDGAKLGSATTSTRDTLSGTPGDPGLKTFILCGESGEYAVLELVDILSAEFSFEEVQTLVSARIMRPGTSIELSWESTLMKGVWLALDPLGARFWYLRRHDDGWVLGRAAARAGGLSNLENRSQRIKWAESALQSRFDMPSAMGRWQIGPAAVGSDSETLYCSFPQSVVRELDRLYETWGLT
jgi:hypothetical protein